MEIEDKALEDTVYTKEETLEEMAQDATLESNDESPFEKELVV